MGRLKKVPSKSAGVRKKFKENLAFVESNGGPAGSKAHVPTLLLALGRFALAAESLTFLCPIIRKLGSRGAIIGWG